MALIYSLRGQQERAAELLQDLLENTHHAVSKKRAANELKAIERQLAKARERKP